MIGFRFLKFHSSYLWKSFYRQVRVKAGRLTGKLVQSARYVRVVAQGRVLVVSRETWKRDCVWLFY